MPRRTDIQRILIIGSGTIMPFAWVTPRGSDILAFCVMSFSAALLLIRAQS